jgi:Tol biopolymer transport system component
MIISFIPTLSLFLSLFLGFPVTRTDLGIFENTLDIGDVRHPGAVEYDPETQTYTLSGSGANMWDGEDQFRYLWTSIQGDFILRAEVSLVGEGSDPHRKAGWVIRNSLDKSSPMVNAALHGDGLTSLQYRQTLGGETKEKVAENTMPSVIQLMRIGDKYIMSTAKKGEPLKAIEITEPGLRNEVFVGLYVCAHNADVIEKAVFKNVRITKPVPKDLVPYRQYLGSRMEVLDIESGTQTVLFESAHSVQAPNWTTDGQKLIYNSNGYLYTYSFADGQIDRLNTGFAISNNNDHVLSFDGEWLGISHHVEEEGGASTIYMLPSSGSNSPKRVTLPNIGHSYLHGISPDNSTVIFTGSRNGKYDLYAADVETGKETQLTDTKFLDDGSEYSPDGKYIYFNSNRTGRMQLWRMKADGSEQERITQDDQFNDWFPHVSPDGKWIVFLSFGTDVDSGDHPFYKHVTLRLMPVDGSSEPKIIAYLYGGQGTINTPSWSPDSKRIAFVSNTVPL